MCDRTAETRIDIRAGFCFVIRSSEWITKLLGVTRMVYQDAETQKTGISEVIDEKKEQSWSEQAGEE